MGEMMGNLLIGWLIVSAGAFLFALAIIAICKAGRLICDKAKQINEAYRDDYDIDRSLILKGSPFEPGRIYDEEIVKAWEWQAAMNNPSPRMQELRKFKRKISRK